MAAAVDFQPSATRSQVRPIMKFWIGVAQARSRLNGSAPPTNHRPHPLAAPHQPSSAGELWCHSTSRTCPTAEPPLFPMPVASLSGAKNSSSLLAGAVLGGWRNVACLTPMTCHASTVPVCLPASLVRCTARTYALRPSRSSGQIRPAGSS